MTRLSKQKTFDINKYSFTKQAYEKNYFAFVSDFVRAHALKEYGGVYLDTDLEVLSNFTELLQGKEVVLGFENKTFVGKGDGELWDKRSR